MTDIVDGLSCSPKRRKRRLQLQALPTVDAVIDTLGGTMRVALLTQCSRSSVWNWRQAGQFPARHYPVISAALALHGYSADMRLFAFVRRSKKTIADVVAA